MTKEIFNLNPFDLGPTTALLQRENNSRLEELGGALPGFEAASAETLHGKKEELDAAQHQLVVVQEETKLLENEGAQHSESKKVREELRKKQDEVQEYLQEQPRILQLETELQTYEKTQLAFREILNTTHTLNKEKELLTHKIEQLTARKQDVLSRLEKEEI